ncbi:MAG: DUF6502 family protein [Acidiferrobacter sp.]
MNQGLSRTVSRLLRPLVRYLIAQGFTVIAFLDLLKVVYVEEALAGDQSRATDSQVSLLTGIHRKEVKRLRMLVAEQDAPAGIGRGTNIAARLVAAWVSSPDMRDRDGILKRLPLHGTNEPSFEVLARRIKADMRPRAIVDDLVRAQAVIVDPDGLLRLVRSAYVPDVPEEKLNFLADNVGDHLASAIHNLGANPPFLERALYLDALPIAVINGMRPRIEAAADHLLQDLHQELTPFETATDVDGVRRLRVGVYYYEDHPPLKSGELP